MRGRRAPRRCAPWKTKVCLPASPASATTSPERPTPNPPPSQVPDPPSAGPPEGRLRPNPPPPPLPPSPPAPPHVSSGVNECGTLLNRTTRVSHSLVPSRCERGRYGGNVPLWGRRGGEGRGPVCLRHRSKGIQAGGDAFAGSLTRVATHST